MSSYSIRAAATALAFLAVAHLAAAPAKKKKKDEEEITQTLEVLPDPPATVRADTSRLVYHLSPLSAKGLLSQQVRDAIKAIWRVNQGATVLKLRAFTAGTGDMRRVTAIVSEMFSEKRLPLPVVSVVQVGALPMEGAQVVIEATSAAKKVQNPSGLAFISGQAVTEDLKPDQATYPIVPLTAKSMAMLRKALAGTGLDAADVVRATCFTSSLDDHAEAYRLVATEYPKAVVYFAQIQREPSQSIVECEAVARLKTAPKYAVELVNPQGLDASPNYSQIALVNSSKLVLSGTQLAFRAQDSDVRLAFDRLKGSLESGGAPIRNVFMSSIYPLSRPIMERVRAIRFEYYDKAKPPASTMLPFQGLPSLDASFAIDVIAVAP